MIGERQAIEIASAAAPGADPARLSVRASLHETPWNECIPRGSTGEYLKERMKQLTGRTYWAVYFAPSRTGVKGGDFCRFVDALTGEVITEVRWK